MTASMSVPLIETKISDFQEWSIVALSEWTGMNIEVIWVHVGTILTISRGIF